MTVDGERPLVANTARGLGVRVGSGRFDDIKVDANGAVTAGNGGMSVVPAWRQLPMHRIPRRLNNIVPNATGHNQDACWRMGMGEFVDGEVTADLVLRLNTPTHGTIEPLWRQPLEKYLLALKATIDAWTIDES
jgi:hypothetical protein